MGGLREEAMHSISKYLRQAEGHAVLGYDAMADPLASGLERARNAILLAEVSTAD